MSCHSQNSSKHNYRSTIEFSNFCLFDICPMGSNKMYYFYIFVKWKRSCSVHTLKENTYNLCFNNHTCDNGPQGHRNTDTYTYYIIPRHAVVKMIQYRTFTGVINTTRIYTISRRDSILTFVIIEFVYPPSKARDRYFFSTIVQS